MVAMDSAKLPITGPCPIDLDAIGFDRSAKNAHCTHCVKSVHNLSNMTAPEARAFLKENAGEKVCVSYARKKDGTIRFKNDQTVVPLSRLRRPRPAALPAAAGLGFAAALAACTPVDNPDVARPAVEETDTPKHEGVVAGKMVVEPPPQDEMIEGGLKLPPDPEPIQEIAGELIVEDVEDVVDGEIEAIDPDPEPDPELDVVLGNAVAEPLDQPCAGEAKPPKAHPKTRPVAPRDLDPL